MIWLSSLALGLASTASIFFTLRVLRLDGRAGTRCGIWFAALIVLTFALPLFVAGTLWIPSAPVVAGSGELSRAKPSDITTAPSRRVPISDVSLPSTTRAPIDVNLIVLTIWLLGVFLSLARAGLGVLRLRKLKRDAIPLQVRATLRGPVRIVVGDLFTVPVSVGYRHPAVVLPRAMPSLQSEGDLENVILHELEHLRRYDDVASLVQIACMSVLWFNPFAYVIANRLAIEREMACDEGVVARTGERARYAATLWKLASCSVPELVPDYVSAFRSKSTTVPRLDNLLTRRPAMTRGAMRCALVAAVALQALVVGFAIASPALLAQSQPIAAFTSLRLPGGDLLVAGGKNADGSAARFAQLYDRRGARIALIPTTVARWSPSLTLLADGNVLVLGGVTDRGVTADAEIYETSARRFRAIAPMTTPRVGHSATLLLDGRVLVASGERAPGQYTGATEIYDPRLGHFTRTMDGDSRVGQLAVLIAGGRVLMTGGRSDGGPSTCTIVYDPTRGIYRGAGRFVARTPKLIVSRLNDGHIVKHAILNT
jgi:beta-lactamase regulating signal transducer with metallopeptidase domain